MQELEDSVITDEDVPKNGIAIMLDSEKFAYFMLGEVPEEVQRTGMAIYKLISYHSGDSSRIARAVDSIVGRNN